MKPLKNRLLVEPIKYQGNIVLLNEGKQTKGRVINVGENVLDVKKDDVVVFLRYAPDEIKHKGKEYYIIKETDVLAKIK